MAVTPSGLHTMTIGMHEGMLTLAFFCIIIIVAAKIYRKTFSRILYIDVEKIIQFVEPASVLGAIGGTIFLVVSAYLGFTIRGGVGTMVNDPLLMNKVMMSVFAEEMWIIFLILRTKYGRDIWNSGPLSAVYAAIGVIGWLFIIETGSLGGHLAGKGSVLDPIYDITGINPEQFFALGTLGTYALIGVCVLAGILFIYVHRRPKTH
ncbi:MAG: hypothetical protein ACE5J6_03410 [Candidatus Bathyarchaeia archaeon]